MNQAPDHSSNHLGISWVNLHNLSQKQRHLINWMRRQKQCSLLDIAVHFCLDEESASEMISPLIQRGFIQKIPQNLDENESYYQVKNSVKKGKMLFKTLREKKED